MQPTSYAHIISDMTWSYSRLKAFEDCPYRWFLRYIRCLPEKELFFSGYGKFMHELLAQCNLGTCTPAQAELAYLTEFRSKVIGDPPNFKVFQNYFQSGLSCLRSLPQYPQSPVAVEENVSFHIDGHAFTGFIDQIDLIGGDFVVTDHKSRNLSARSKRSAATAKDAELDGYLRQLYLYAIAVKQKYGSYPKALVFNCFRSNQRIVEPFCKSACEKAKQWAIASVQTITHESNFAPSPEYFKCRFLCGMQDSCVYRQLV